MESIEKIMKTEKDGFLRQAKFTVLNEKGLHTRPSTELVKCAATFDCEISLLYREYTVNAKSLLGILMLAAGKGAKIKIQAVGNDAEKALDSLVNLANNKFNIHY